MIKKVLSLVVSVMVVLMTISFSVSMSTKDVYAEEVTGCCIKDDAGNYCSDDSTQDACKDSFYSGIKCSEVSGQGGIPGPCERVTCLEEEGSCSARKYYRQCVDGNGGWSTSSLDSIEECNPGCCQLSREGDVKNQYPVIFGLQCRRDAAKLDLDFHFIEGECEILEEQVGCCVSTFGCDLTTESECSGEEWFGEEFCSDLPNVCGDCGDYDMERCYKGDVYGFNRCNEPSPEPEDDCEVNTQMCGNEGGSAQCEDISCEIPINFTTLNYDALWLKSGEVGIQYGEKIGKVNVNENYKVQLENGESACVQYQGPGETHIVYTCDRGEVEDATISVFKGRDKICEWNKTTERIDIRDNKYETCLECSSVEQKAEGKSFISDKFAFIKALTRLGQLAGWKALDLESWDYWLAAPGLCNDVGSCREKGDCIHDGESNWCTPLYPVDSVELCNAFTESKAGSPWDKPDEACSSCGSCAIDSDRKLSYLGTLSICLADTLSSAVIDWAMGEATDYILSDDEKATSTPPTEEDSSGSNLESYTGDSGPSKTPGEGDDPVQGTKDSWSRVKGIGESFNENIIKKVIYPILTLGGLIDFSVIERATKAYFLGVEYDNNKFTDKDGTEGMDGPISIYKIDGKVYYLEENTGRLVQGEVIGGKIVKREISDLSILEGHEPYKTLGRETNPSIPIPPPSYTVVSGDTLSGIANKYGVTTQAMVRANSGKYPSLETNPGMIQPGWIFTIPQKSPIKFSSIKSNFLVEKLRGPLFAPTITQGEPHTYYGQTHFVEYTEKETNEYGITKQWLKAWWEGVGGFWGLLMERLKLAAVNVGIAVLIDSTIGKILKDTFADEFFDAVDWLNPQRWFRAAACRLVGVPGLGEGFAQLCENKYFFNFVSCAIITATQQDSFNAGVCIPHDYREVGYDNCYLCNEDLYRDCTAERCNSLGTDCCYGFACGGDVPSGVCDVTKEALEKCGDTVNQNLVIENDLSKGFKVNYTDVYLDLGIETSKSAMCRYAEEPKSFEDMIEFDDNDRAGIHHSTELWAGDTLIDDYKYFVKCKWACKESDWGIQFSPMYEINIKKLPKGDLEPPTIKDSYPYTAQLLEATDNVVMWVEGDESLSDCKYDLIEFDEFIDEAQAIIATNADLDVTDNEAQDLIDNMLLSFELLNPTQVMTKKSDTKYETQLTVELGKDYAYSVVCWDKATPTKFSSRPKIILFRVSNPFDVTVTDPENGITTSEKIKEIKASSGAKETECRYSFETKERYGLMLPFFETGGRTHLTELAEPLKSGDHVLYVSCVDFDTLDLATGVSDFTIMPDTMPPKLVRIFGGDKLSIETNEDTNCTYSDEGFTKEQAPMANFGEGNTGYYKEHSLYITNSNIYYITCVDRETNMGKYTIYP